MKLYKVKRPGGVYSFDVEAVAEDEFGTWLHAPRNSAWQAPDDAGVLPFDALLLIDPARFWVAWWVDDPADRRVEIDVCLCPVRVTDGWRYVDLELDPVRHDNGIIEIEDRDEFDAAFRNGWVSVADAAIADATATELEAALVHRNPPFGDDGWQRLARLRGAP